MLLKVIQISKYDAAGGGASRVAEQLTDELQQRGHKVTHLVRGAAKGFNQYRKPLYGSLTKKAKGWVDSKGWIDVIPFELPFLLFNKDFWTADLVHFHDISGTCSPLSIMLVSRLKPAVWTLHDVSVLTAGCTYPLDCTSFGKGCGSCPQVGTWPLITNVDRTSWLLKFRQWCLEKSKVNLVSPSKWLAELVQQHTALYVNIINNGVDTEIFNPASKPELNNSEKELVDLIKKSKKKKILLAAASLDSPYKGVREAIDEINSMPASENIVILMGKGSSIANKLNCEVIEVGYIDDDEFKAEIMRLVDVLYFLSEAENYPLLLLEAIASGTEIKANPVGGVSEIIDLLEDGSEYQSDIERTRINLEKILSKIDLRHMVENYIDLYENILQQKHIKSS